MKGIIFDFNGTLFLDSPYHEMAWKRYAREELEKWFGTKVYLNLWVKVKENWRDSAGLVSNFGYSDKE